MTDSPSALPGGDLDEAPSHGPPNLDGEMQQGFYAQFSREMVRIYKEQFGRGPTKARTNYAGPDCVICTLEESLTPAEKNMVAMNEHQRVRDMRLLFQHASEAEFCEVAERLTGRKVRAFISGTDTHQDVSSEVFYLEPRPEA
jgi:uncharacterized protein YbcI